MAYYLKQLIINSIESKGSNIKVGIKYNYYEDDLFHVGLHFKPDPLFAFDGLKNLDKLSSSEIKKKIINHKYFKIVPKGEFISELLNDFLLKNWVEIESLYFEQIYSERNNLDVIKQFNKQLKFFKSVFIEYLKLKTGKFQLKKPLIEEFNEVFSRELEYEKINPEVSFIYSKVSKLYFLNFNYTDLLGRILKESALEEKKYIINNIHGSIDEKDFNIDNIIFGYGDKDSEKFKELLSLNQNSLLENFKTFHYKARAGQNYDSLMKMINGNSIFQVIVIGHSCQLSDKALLKDIMLNENCFSVNLFHYKGVDEFLVKSMELNRISGVGDVLGSKIFRFDEKDSIPQSKK